MWSDFRSFLFEKNVFGLALAVILGSATNRVVGSLVDSIIMPVVGVILPAEKWKEATFEIGSVRFLVGDFFAAVLHFVIIAFIVWRLTKWFLSPKTAAKKEVRHCPFCQLEVHASATRCAHCTSEIGAATA